MQLLALGVTITLPAIGCVPVFVVTNDAMFPFPVAAKPIAVLLFAQAKVVPETPKLLVNTCAFVDEPTQ